MNDIKNIDNSCCINKCTPPGLVRNNDKMNKVLDDKVLDDNEMITKYEIIIKIVKILNNNEAPIPPINLNQKPILIIEDRLAYRVDQLFSSYNIVVDIKCGRLQTTKKLLIEHLELLPISILFQFCKILEYDRCIYNLLD